MLQRKLFFLVFLTCSVLLIKAQDVDLNQMLEDEQKKEEKDKVKYTEATFKTTRLINGHSIENTQKGIMDFKISHRFGTINGGAYEMFGLDNASMRMGFDFGITPRLMLGFGRSTYQKQYDAFAKYKLLRQSTGKRNMPVSLAVMTSAMVTTMKWTDPDRPNYFSSRLQYAHQIIVARKFSESTSIQIMPTLVHYNIVKFIADPNDIIAIGIGGRQKISPRVSINVEYYYQLPGYKMPDTENSLSFGFDIETGGHVFQLHITNSRGMTERTFISETAGKWSKGDIMFGFNISRVFTLKKQKKK
ncbi:MAG: hypothetical protein IPK31_09630 [Chitinophagaceae bacterium]|nr:hypothetical protein [Chitinophagaceae bacterium]